MDWKRLWTWVWALVPAWTLGFGTPVIMVNAAVRLRDRRQTAMAGIYCLALVCELIFAQGNGNDNDAIFIPCLSINLVVGLVHAVAIRGKMFPRVTARAALTPVQQQKLAIANVRSNEDLRERARAVVAEDPGMARELAIGRPDQHGRDYPDGGLVDANHATRSGLCTLGMPLDLAEEIVTTREKTGDFMSYDEMLMLLESDGREFDAYKDRLVFVPSP